MKASIALPRKTALGVEEMRQRTHGLSQRHRTMLLLVNGKRERHEVLTLARQAGVDSVFFDELLAMGLVEAGASSGAVDDAMSEPSGGELLPPSAPRSDAVSPDVLEMAQLLPAPEVRGRSPAPLPAFPPQFVPADALAPAPVPAFAPVGRAVVPPVPQGPAQHAPAQQVPAPQAQVPGAPMRAEPVWAVDSPPALPRVPERSVPSLSIASEVPQSALLQRSPTPRAAVRQGAANEVAARASAAPEAPASVPPPHAPAAGRSLPQEAPAPARGARPRPAPAAARPRSSARAASPPTGHGADEPGLTPAKAPARRARMQMPASAAQPDDASEEKLLSEVRQLLIGCLQVDSPVLGTLTALRVRKARSRADLAALVWDIERRLSKSKRPRSTQERLVQVRDLLGLGNTVVDEHSTQGPATET